MARRQQLAWPLPAALAFFVAFSLHAGGYLDRLEYGFAEMRAKLLAHETSSDIVIVGIDSSSLQALSEWPWPRRHYARLLQHLDGAKPRTVFIDIDFSSHSNGEDDELFEHALAAWSGSPILLAAHFQLQDGKPDPDSLTLPLPRFARHTQDAAVMLEQSADGLVRSMRSSWRHGEQVIGSVFTAASDLPPGTPVDIDFSILPSSFGSISFSELINGEVDLSSLQGKTVYVGATAVELRDVVPVPLYRTLPGVVVQALAAETLRAGRLLAPPPWLYTALLALSAALFSILMNGHAWRRNASLLTGGVLALSFASVYFYSVHRTDIPVTPLAAVLVFAFAATTLRSLDVETWRAWAYAIRLKRRDALLRSIVSSTSDGIVCIDDDGLIRTANPATSRLFGCSSHHLIGADIRRFMPGLLDTSTFSALVGGVSEWKVMAADGREFPVDISVSRVAVEEDPLYTAIIRDVSDRKAQERRLEHQANHDALTGLPNRRALYAGLDALLAGDADKPSQIALLLVDLSRFNEVNDTLGHDVGDEVLVEAARRLKGSLNGNELLARIGGDEFAVVVSATDGADEVDVIAGELTESLKAPIHARGVAIEVGANIGIAMFPDDGRDSKELLRRADVAMYGAKRRGSSFEYYDRHHDGHTVRRLSMTGELRAALTNDEISLHYQPQVNLRTGRAEGVEALVRWRHPTLGNVSPEEFIGLAEATNLIRPLTKWTFHQALTDVARWNESGVQLRVALNLSARMLQDVEFVDQLGAMLDSYSVAPDQVEIEITESAMMLDPKQALRTVSQLHQLGIPISIDDYGTGFSSLGYLRDLQVHALKLDKSFITDLEQRQHNRVIVESTVHLAHALGLAIVAEGVETRSVMEYLTSIGYDVGQGYWFSRALPADECIEWIEHFNRPPERQALPVLIGRTG